MNGNASIYRFMARSVSEMVVEERLSTRHNTRLLIWSILNLEQVLKETTHV
jgi:hypothetical protein